MSYADQTAATRRAIVRAIGELHSETGLCPTIREVAQRIGCSSARVGQLLPGLRSDGAVSYEPGRARTLRAPAIGRARPPTA